MKILVCYKLVPDDQDITVNKDNSLALKDAAIKIGAYDLNAVEAGNALARELPGSSVVGLSVGGKDYLSNSKARKDILARGPDSLTLVMDDAYASLPPQATAQALAKAAEKEGFDLILCGEGSGDLYSQQVGTLLGEYLGVHNTNAVRKITLGDGRLTVERGLENETQVLELPLPAVLSVSTDINEPNVPTIKNILGAAKKPVKELSPADTGAGVELAAETISILAPEMADRLKVIVEGDSDENIATFINNVRKTFS
jgi:electron transfer flavoprotein beta subunit